MSTVEMKKEIVEKVNTLNDSELEFVLNMLSDINREKSNPKYDISKIWDNAVKQYGNVLAKLAQ